MTTRITKEFLIKKLAKFVEEYGRIPLLKEFGHSSNIHMFYGTYANFLKSQGFDKKKIMNKLTKDELVEKLHAFVKANNRIPNSSEFGYFSLVDSYYGSFYEFVLASGYESLLHDSQMSRQKKEDLEKPNDPISIECLINKLVAFVDKHGRTPSAKEMGHEYQLKKIFGSYNTFIRSQGFTPHHGITKSELEQELRTFVEANERIPKTNELKHYSAIQRLYGNYPAFLKANGYTREYQLKNRKNYISKEFLIRKLTGFVEEHGQTPTAAEMGHTNSIKKYFGSYTAFIRSQGFTARHGINKNELEQKFRTFFEVNGRIPTTTEFGHHSAIRRLYGNYPDFLRANGCTREYQLKNKKNYTSKEFLIRKLTGFVEEHGQTPTAAEMGHGNSIRKFFGSYNAFIRSQGFTARHWITKNELEQKFRTFLEVNERIPTTTEFGHYSAIRRLYGNYPDFLKANGYIKPERKKKTLSASETAIISEFLEDMLNKFVEENGRIPTSTELGYKYFIDKVFGSYAALLQSQGYQLKREHLSKEGLQDKLRS